MSSWPHRHPLLTRAAAIVGGSIAGLAILLALVVVTGPPDYGWRADMSYGSFVCGKGDLCFQNVTRQRDGTGREHSVHLNAMGFRGPDLAVSRQRREAVRIQLYGDSMIFGTGVDDGNDLSGALARELAARHPDRTFEVQNFGNPMNYMPSNLRAYFTYGREFDPDIVVFSYMHTGHRDMNHRLVEIKNSSVAQALMPYAWGRWLINLWQVRTAQWSSDADREQHVRQPLRQLARDEQERGVAVVFWEFWARHFDGLHDVVPDELEYTTVSSNLDFDTYRQGDLCIQGDGHPTPKGHAFFAKRLADGLEPILAGERLAARRGFTQRAAARQ